MQEKNKNCGIMFHPKRGAILMCNFEGNVVPEIVKKRPVVVITPQLPYRNNLVMVIPLSSTPPKYKVPYVIKLSHNYLGKKDVDMYAKCDLVCSVSFKRLDRLKTGFRKYDAPLMDKADFNSVIKGLKKALGL